MRERKPVCPHATGTAPAQNARTTTIKPTTAFSMYANIRARRAIEQAAATARFMVKSVNKDGSITRAKPTPDKWLRDAFATIEEAEKRRALEAMNLGQRFVVVAL